MPGVRVLDISIIMVHFVDEVGLRAVDVSRPAYVAGC